MSTLPVTDLTTLPLDEKFKEAFRNHPAGVAVITADPGEGPVGLTASSVISVSADPPMLVFSLSTRASATPHLLRAESVVVHMLGADQLGLARNFATGGIDRFADRSSWYRLATGEPVLRDAPVWLRGRVARLVPAGESTVVALSIDDIEVPTHGAATVDPLVYHNRTWHTLSSASEIS